MGDIGRGGSYAPDSVVIVDNNKGRRGSMGQHTAGLGDVIVVGSGEGGGGSMGTPACFVGSVNILPRYIFTRPASPPAPGPLSSCANTALPTRAAPRRGHGGLDF